MAFENVIKKLDEILHDFDVGENLGEIDQWLLLRKGRMVKYKIEHETLEIECGCENAYVGTYKILVNESGKQIVSYELSLELYHNMKHHPDKVKIRKNSSEEILFRKALKLTPDRYHA